MRKHVSTITTVLVFLTGLSLLLYPTVSNYWNFKHQTQAVAEYSDRIEKMDEQEKKLAFEQAEKYNETLISNPGRFTPTEEQDEWYKSLLNIDGTGMMGYISGSRRRPPGAGMPLISPRSHAQFMAVRA